MDPLVSNLSAIKQACLAIVPLGLRQWLRRVGRSTDGASAEELPEQLEQAQQAPPAALHDPPPAELPAATAPSYAQRIEQENEIFADQLEVHALPEIFHYWSNRHLLPLAQEFGFQHPEHFLAQQLFASARRTGASHPRFISLGAGNCDAEVRIARSLQELGLANFSLECLDINESMLARGLAAASEAGVGQQIIPLRADFNDWRPQEVYHGIVANQSLHHVLALEHLLDAVHEALAPEAIFAVSDMIGRNGHLRWPEALVLVREFWAELPESYRENLLLRRHEQEFMDWDCSGEGFEGIRAQDILPLLIERFGFEAFFAYGNLIDPFIDRGFGHHFSEQRPWDRDFIDRVHARDEVELRAGRIKPTHMLAALVRHREAPCRYRGNLSPAFCVRAVDD